MIEVNFQKLNHKGLRLIIVLQITTSRNFINELLVLLPASKI